MKTNFMKLRPDSVPRPRPELRLVLLREIAEHGPGHGLDLYDRLVERGHPAFLKNGKAPWRGDWKETRDRNSVYPVLRELEREGHLTREETEPLPERGNRPRIIYSITETGRRLLEAS